MKKHLSKRLLSLLLALVLCVGLALPAAAAGTSGGTKVTFEKVDNDAVSVKPFEREEDEETEETAPYEDDENVRVSIVLNGKSTIEHVGTTEDIASNVQATSYRALLEQKQENCVEAISKAIGEQLDVVWNLTLAANIISANVDFAKIETIEALSSVKEVLIETRYEPDVAEDDLPVDPSMSTSSVQTGSSAAYAAGYTGAGTRIAIIDTGVDTAHQSFDGGALDYSLRRLAEQAEDKDYIDSLNLLDADEIAGVLDKLNASKRYGDGLTAAQLYRNTKLAFGFNYVDSDLNIDHLSDTQGEHGSHVAGIATANAYVPNEDGTYSNALDEVYVQGVAPDAQLVVMKVFGVKGGAYDSDYMAAIEDAIILGCDSINLSLGSGNPGMTRYSNEEYAAILDSLTEAGAVVAMSVGNSGSWVENAYNAGYLYADDVSMDTVGSPGSYTNSLGVASVDNDGYTGEYLTVGDYTIFYTQTSGTNEPMTTIAGDQDYVLIDGLGTEEDWAAVGDVLAGKIAICSRGTISFYEKAENAVAAGAIATIIYNNTSGTISMDLSDYTQTEPCVSVTQYDGAVLRALATPVEDAEGNALYYVGTLAVGDSIGTVVYDSDYYTMSSFSSWGVPGSLELKPEITAPGGNIYSVNGRHYDEKNGPLLGGTDAYENMSGTSMASPQVAGMAALVAQYIKENNLQQDGLTVRALAQSLLMSTAVPMWEDYGDYGEGYYSVLQQGAGLANVGNAVSAKSYILMGEDATASDADGKVKVELGDDPEKTGIYQFSFSIHNLTDEELTYELSADLFTQDLFQYYVNNAGDIGLYMDTWTTLLNPEILWGTSSHTNTVTVSPGGAEYISVSIVLTAEDKDFLAYYDNGAYIEGYVYATPVTTEEGEMGVTHSIPVLGFYGNWSDPSMYDLGSYAEYATGDEYRIPYLGRTSDNTLTVSYASEPGTDYYFGGNPLVPDDTYMPERNAVNGADTIKNLYFTAIRNAAAGELTVVLNGTETLLDQDLGTVYSAFYYVNGGSWQNTQSKRSISITPSAVGAVDGDTLEITVTLVPEYYVDAEGSYDPEALGEGATLSIPVVVDNAAPVVNEIQISEDGAVMTVTATDNHNVAAVALYNAGGEMVLTYTGAKQTSETGDDYALDLSDVNGNRFLLQVYDYAMNTATYAVEMQIGEDLPVPEMIAFDLDEGAWLGFSAGDALGDARWLTTPRNSFFAAADVDGMIFAATDSGALYVLDEKDLSVSTFVADMGVTVTDMAYNAATGTLYGVAEGYLVEIDRLTGEVTPIDPLPLNTNTLACDESGNFYSIAYGTGDVYRFTEDDLWGTWFDFNGDGITNNADGQALLDYATGARTGIYNGYNADLDGDRDIDSHDAYMFFQYVSDAAELVCETGLRNNYVQSLELEPDTGLLYWARFYYDGKATHSQLVEINPATGTSAIISADAAEFGDELAALVIPQAGGDASWAAPTDTVTDIVLSEDNLTILCGQSAVISANVLPWTATDRSVIWSTSDASIATVNNGVIQALAEGTCTITATSSLDPTKTASCTVTVEKVHITLEGVLQDEEGYPMTFTWNMERDDTWRRVNDIEPAIAAAAYDSVADALYVQDSSSELMYKIDKDTGETIAYSDESCAFGAAVSDMAAAQVYTSAENPLMFAVSEGYLLLSQPTMSNTFDTGFNLGYYLSKYTGASDLIAIASIGRDVDEDGEYDLLYALDDTGTIWALWYYEEDGEPGLGLNYAETDLKLDVTFYNGMSLCSMVLGEDGNLYLSYFTGETNEIYRLSYDEDSKSFVSVCLGDVGSSVWPAALYAVRSNTAAEVEEPVGSESLKRGRQDVSNSLSVTGGTSVRPDATMQMACTDKTAALSAQRADTPVNPLSNSDVSDEGKTLTLTVTAKDADGNDADSTNGVIGVSFNPEVLSLQSVQFNSDFRSVNAAGLEDGEVTLGYVSLAGIPAGTPVATLVFSMADNNLDATKQITVTHMEIGNVHLALSENTEEKVDTTCDHSNVIRKNEKAPTLLTPGYSGDLVCADCGKVMKTGYEILPVASINTATEPEKPTEAMNFTDVSVSDSFYDAVKYVYEEGLMNGVSDTRFAPESTLTRAMVVTILYRIEGEPSTRYNGMFPDVANYQWYTNAVEWAAKNNIVTGYTTGKFGPEDPVTREQLAAILYRYAQSKGCVLPEGAGLSGYADGANVSSYAVTAVKWAVAEGILEAQSGKLQPRDAANRAQVAIAVAAFHQKYVK